jgi:peptide/nickel transport system ATP-binding protein
MVRPSPEPSVILDIRNLRVQFPSGRSSQRSAAAVDGLNLSLTAGQALGIVGESGSGKSVSCLSILGLLPDAAQVTGEAWFSGAQSSETQSPPVNLLSLTPRQLQDYRGSAIALIFQEPMSSLNPVYRCGDQIIETLRHHEGLSVQVARSRTIALLQEVRLLGPESSPREQQALLDRYPHQLSGGQLQRMMIAMALSCNPSLLIADEPTTALDVTVQATILELLRELRRNRGMSMIFVSHDLDVVRDVVDQVVIMYRGKIVESGPIAQVFNHPQHPYTKGLLACRPRLGQPKGPLPCVADFMSVETLDSGELRLTERAITPNSSPTQNPSPTQSPPELGDLGGDAGPQSSSKSPALLTVRNLRVEFTGQGDRPTIAVNDLSFEVYPGETLGLVGESGCGKSSLARALLRLIPTTAGQIVFDGQDIAKLPDRRLRQLRRDLQIVFQDPSGALDPRYRAGDAILEPMQIHGLDKRRKPYLDRVRYLLDVVGLGAGMIDRLPHELSGGQKQRLCIARALALNPRLIICDESVSALDVSVQAQVLNLLRDLQREFGLTYIFISHDLSVVHYMSDRIMVMNQGRIEEIGPADQLYRSPQRDYTRQLIAAIPGNTTHGQGVL